MFKNIKNYPQNSQTKSVKFPQKKRQTPQIPKSHAIESARTHLTDHVIDCKTYDKCKVTEKFIETPEILNFKARHARNFSEKDAPGWNTPQLSKNAMRLRGGRDAEKRAAEKRRASADGRGPGWRS